MKETLIHAIVQLVVTAAVAIYFFKKNKEIVKQVELNKAETEESFEELRKEIKFLKEQISLFKNILAKTHGVKFAVVKNDVNTDLEKIKALEKEVVEDDEEEDEEEEQTDLREEVPIKKTPEINKKKKNLSPPKFRNKNV